MVDECFAEKDTNQDGTITREEAREFAIAQAKEWGDEFDEEACEASWKKVDLNNDGKLTKEELFAAICGMAGVSAAIE